MPGKMLAFGKNVKALRILRRMSQEALAEQCNISRSWINQIESGSDTTISKAHTLAKALKVPVHFLFLEPEGDPLLFFAKKMEE